MCVYDCSGDVSGEPDRVCGSEGAEQPVHPQPLPQQTVLCARPVWLHQPQVAGHIAQQADQTG